MSENIDRNAQTLNVQMKQNISNPRLASLRSINAKGAALDNQSSSYQVTSNARVPAKFGEESKHASAPQFEEPEFDRERVTPSLSEARNARQRSDGFADGTKSPGEQMVQSPHFKGQAMKTERQGSKKKQTEAENALDGQHSYESKVPESLHEKQQQTMNPRHKNQRMDSGKPLNMDIPVDKKPQKKAKRVKPGN